VRARPTPGLLPAVAIELRSLDEHAPGLVGQHRAWMSQHRVWWACTGSGGHAPSLDEPTPDLVGQHRAWMSSTRSLVGMPKVLLPAVAIELRSLDERWMSQQRARDEAEQVCLVLIHVWVRVWEAA
jgi:hypothetical protein